MECPICHNGDPFFFFERNGQLICRKCLPYQRPVAAIPQRRPPLKVDPRYAFPLTGAQQKLSTELVQGGHEMFVAAVCGAGKTEATFASIALALRAGKRVGYATPRRELVKELGPRLHRAFPTAQVSMVYGGHVQVVDGDIVVVTTHQLARYPAKFGLLIIDEYDAFPFEGNAALHGYATRSCYGRFIYLSATFSAEGMTGKPIVELIHRPHGKPLPIPQLIVGSWVALFRQLQIFLHRQRQARHPVILYVPTRSLASHVFQLIKALHPNVVLIHSTSPNKEVVFRNIQQGNFGIAIATTILERGVTIDHIQVVVLWADHPVFQRATLLQMAGRVGRTIQHPFGQVLFLARTPCPVCQDVVKEVKRLHEAVSTMREGENNPLVQ